MFTHIKNKEAIQPFAGYGRQNGGYQESDGSPAVVIVLLYMLMMGLVIYVTHKLFGQKNEISIVADVLKIEPSIAGE